MAENKKSVLLYCDIIHVVSSLTDEEAGKLFKHYLQYINDLNPEAPDRLTTLLFEPIKQNLKRDLKKWEESSESKSEAGALGNLKRWNPDLHAQVLNEEITLKKAVEIAKHRYAIFKSQKLAKIAVIDTVNVTVTDKVTDKDILLNNYSDTEDSRNGIVIYDKESLISELENTKWIKDLALRFKLDDLTTKSKLNEFADDLKLKSGYKRNLAEIKTHFFNVLNKKVEVDKKTTIVQPTRKFAGS